jgi:orotidine-5'-phosphate decarboxylase
MNLSKTKIFCAIDVADEIRAEEICASLAAAQSGVGIKLGMEYFGVAGPKGVARMREKYPDLALFLDLKYHDIPNTVAGAVRVACATPLQYLNLHATGGLEMMRAAQDAMMNESAKRGFEPPRLLAVTVLTALDAEALEQVGQGSSPEAQVLRLARLTQAAGLAGVVCSPHEIETMRKEFGHDFVLMVPGIRPKGSDTGDQKRIMTPEDAFARGATHLVIGRPITGAKDPGTAAAEILKTL